jgi:FkbM family methyltransferase
MMRNLKILAAAENPVRFLVSRLLWRSGLCRFVTIPRSGYKLKFFPTALSATMWLSGKSERDEEERLLAKLLRSGDNYVDVGANIGALAIAGKLSVGPAGQVIAIEAHPRTAGFLRDNVSLNKLDIRCINIAVGNESGEIVFSDIRSDDQNKVIENSNSGITVNVERLDNILDFKIKIRLLKIDVEGYEINVLNGSKNILNNTDFVLFESWDSHFEKFGYALPDIISLFESCQFSVFRLTNETDLQALDSAARSQTCENLLAARKHCLEELKHEFSF